MDTGSSNFDEMENSLGSIKELSEKIAKSSNIMNTNMQNDDLNQCLDTTQRPSIESNTNNWELAREENKGSSEQAINRVILNINNLIKKNNRECGAEDVEQGLKKGDEIEIIVGMTAALKQVADDNSFIQITSKRNRKKTNILVMDKRLSSIERTGMLGEARFHQVNEQLFNL
ncbi:6155_t:CDS:2 [Gigaspora margarita]|uniref:6155_t:CDS:1 n=1 Tax=Gigaspora margarita TaxID=4874 RepID=A0ABM8W6A3_GIGMA|nr:6155_t:CDS:2 [Gigaspora margarita]